MVKSRPRQSRAELNEQVDLLASQFVERVGLGGEGQAQISNNEQMLNWSSTNPRQLNAGSDSDSATSAAPGEVQHRALISPEKFSSLGFEVDLTGSQMSDTPFLRPKAENLMSMAPAFEIRAGSDNLRPKLRVVAMKRKEERFKKKRAERLSTGFIVNRLIHSARRRLLTDLSLIVPGSIEQIKCLDPSGNGEVVWGVVKCWLDGQPDLKAQMNLTTKALTLIATHAGPPVEARSLQALKVYAVVVCKLDADTYKEICSFLFPEDDHFSPNGVC